MKFIADELASVRLAVPKLGQLLQGINQNAGLRRAEDSFSRFRIALRTQVAVIHALILREVITRYVKHRLGFLWAFGEPLLYLAVWFTVHYVVWGSTHDGMSTILFLSTGLLPYIMFKEVYVHVQHALDANKALFHFSVVKPFDAWLARFLLEAATTVTVTVMICACFIALGIIDLPDDPIRVMYSSLVLLLMGFSFGTFNSVMMAVWPTYAKILVQMAAIIFYTSGILFTARHLPPRLAEVVHLNPVMHCIEMFRSGWIPGYPPVSENLSYPTFWTLALFFSSMIMEIATRIQREED